MSATIYFQMAQKKKEVYMWLKVNNWLIKCDKWNIACHISKQRMSQSSAIAVTADSELVSPEGTQEGKEYLPSSSHHPPP